MFGIHIISWALIFILRLRFQPGKSLVDVLKPNVSISFDIKALLILGLLYENYFILFSAELRQVHLHKPHVSMG